jgi:hypothetical protein
MPYIADNQRREKLDDGLETPMNAGELNFKITKLLDNYLYHHGLSYTTMNEIVGVMECAKLEFYRRIASPYEEKKIRENGDVFTLSNLS